MLHFPGVGKGGAIIVSGAFRLRPEEEALKTNSTSNNNDVVMVGADERTGSEHNDDGSVQAGKGEERKSVAIGGGLSIPKGDDARV